MASDGVFADDIKSFARDLRRVDDTLIRRQSTRRLKGVADEGVLAAKAAAQAIPAKDLPSREGPLRPLLANAIRPQWRSGGKEVGVSVVVSRARLGKRAGAEKVLEYGGRHPTFGHQPWIRQEPLEWFRTALAPMRAAALVQLRKVMDDIATTAGFK